MRQRGTTAPRRALRGTVVRLVNTDMRPWLARVTTSTLLIWGDRDRETRWRTLASWSN